MKKNKHNISVTALGKSLILAILLFGVTGDVHPQGEPGTTTLDSIRTEARKIMREGDIPGASIVILQNGQQTILNLGYTDKTRVHPVTDGTLFQLGSCSKAFTALAVVQLEHQNAFSLDDKVKTWLPWWKTFYKRKPVDITLRQLLHHTSGIPWNTISRIPAMNTPDALEQTVRQLAGVELDETPGKRYQYATMNYDVLALVIQKVTGMPFETYMQERIFRPLGLSSTTIGAVVDSNRLAAGFKIGFFTAREYEAPIFRGNDAAGYIISDARDIASWLRFQMNGNGSPLYPLAEETHRRDETVPLHGMSSYAMGWNVSLSGDGELYHDGLNPNYSSYINFRPAKNLGVAVLANSNSHFTPLIANNIMRILAREELIRDYDGADRNDKVFSLVSFIVLLYFGVVLALLVRSAILIYRGERVFKPLKAAAYGKIVRTLAMAAPFLLAIYLFPTAFANFTWESMLVWAPVSFPFMIGLILAAMGFSFLTWVLSLLFPETNKYKGNAPRILALSILSGIGNMVVITIVTSALNSGIELKYLVFYYVLTLLVYLFGRKFVQTSLIRLNTDLVYEQRIKLIDRVFSTAYQKFEKMDRGRIYSALNDDINTLGDSANLVVIFITSFFTAIGVFLYLATLAAWATVLTVTTILVISTVYYFVSRSTNKYFEFARDTQTHFMRLINGMVEGFKELSLHRRKKREYREDVSAVARDFRENTARANIRFINAFLVGESLLVVLLGGVVFALPKMFPDIQDFTILSFVILLLYLINPVNGILNSLPGIFRIRIAWNRIQAFYNDIPIAPAPVQTDNARTVRVESIRVEDLRFRYPATDGVSSFSVGPANLCVSRGEAVFIIGGNGSGKTTLAKLLTGLYEPDEGAVYINDEHVGTSDLGEYFSCVFTPAYLFEKLYAIDTDAKAGEFKEYLRSFGIEDKVGIKNGRYSTIDLSGGQKKRLALLQCLLEDSPIFLFDECAADQDPEFRRFFYRTLIPEMKEMGKIVIAITHDDHYFDVADRVLKMNEGKFEAYEKLIPVTS